MRTQRSVRIHMAKSCQRIAEEGTFRILLLRNHDAPFFYNDITLFCTFCKAANIRTRNLPLIAKMDTHVFRSFCGKGNISRHSLFCIAIRQGQLMPYSVIIQRIQHFASPPFTTSGLS